MVDKAELLDKIKHLKAETNFIEVVKEFDEFHLDYQKAILRDLINSEEHSSLVLMFRLIQQRDFNLPLDAISSDKQWLNVLAQAISPKIIPELRCLQLGKVLNSLCTFESNSQLIAKAISNLLKNASNLVNFLDEQKFKEVCRQFEKSELYNNSRFRERIKKQLVDLEISPKSNNQRFSTLLATKCPLEFFLDKSLVIPSISFTELKLQSFNDQQWSKFYKSLSNPKRAPGSFRRFLTELKEDDELVALEALADNFSQIALLCFPKDNYKALKVLIIKRKEQISAKSIAIFSKAMPDLKFALCDLKSLTNLDVWLDFWRTLYRQKDTVESNDVVLILSKIAKSDTATLALALESLTKERQVAAYLISDKHNLLDLIISGSEILNPHQWSCF